MTSPNTLIRLDKAIQTSNLLRLFRLIKEGDKLMGYRIQLPILIGTALITLSMSLVGFAQVVAETPLETSETNTVLDKNPIGTARSASLSESLGAVADDLDALIFNPAGIGGSHQSKKIPFIRKLYFPHISLFANKDSLKLNQEFRREGAANDGAIGQALVDAHAGKRQYGRISSVVGLVFGRLIAVPYHDIQVAAVSQGNGSDLVDMRYRSQSGIGYGFSVMDTSETFALGYSGYIAQRSEIYGSFLYAEMIDKSARKQILKDNTTKSTATAHNVGMTWQLAKTASPKLTLVMRDIGNTNFKKNDETDPIVYKQDLNAGFSLGNAPGKSQYFTYMLEAGRLLDDEITIPKKLKTSMEWTYDGSGTYARLGAHAGYTFAGPSAGLSINIGIVSMTAGFYSVDIGTGNDKLTEGRYTGTFNVNVAEQF